MIETCKLCSEDFLTEANPYVVIPSPGGIELHCLCHYRKLEIENAQLRDHVMALSKIALEMALERSEG